jgi:diguanylate cyclase (GGDEF)-like protein
LHDAAQGRCRIPAEPWHTAGVLDDARQPPDALEPQDAAYRRLQQLTRLPAAEAVAPLREALAEAERSGQPWHQALARVALGRLLFVQDADAALAMGQAALHQAQALGWRAGQAQALTVIGLAQRERGELAESLAALEQALQIEREGGDPLRQAQVLSNLSAPLERVGRRDAALQALEEALHLLPALPEDAAQAGLRHILHNNQAAALASRARSDRDAGLAREQWEPDARRAEEIARGLIALPAAERRQALRSEHYPRGCLAKALVVLDRLDEALPLLAELEQIYAAANDYYALLYVRLEQCRAWLQAGEAARARDLAQVTIALARERHFEHFLESLWLVLSQAHEALGAWREALEAFQAYHLLKLHAATLQAEAGARSLAVRLDTARAQRESRRDALTGLLNRRGFDELLSADLAQAGAGRPLALLLIDLDHFKAVNDRDGHARGDEALVLLAQVLQRNCRAQDRAARLGGDEFALLGTMDTDSALQVAQRLRHTLRHESLARWPDRPPLTLSIGCAEVHQPGSAQALVQRADAALYAVKAAGRDGVRVG